MTDEKSKKDPKVKESSPKEPAKDQKSVGSKQKSADSKKKSEESSSAKATADKKKKKNSEKKSILTQKEIDALIVENADLKAVNKEANENFLLLAAEFENFKKRINKDQLRSKELYKEKMLGDLLPVLDDIERGLQHHKDDETGKAFSLIKSKLLSYLETYDVKPFDSVGEEFDPEKHDAMLTRAEETKKDNLVLEEFEKGYMIGEKVLRHAKVIVNIIE